MALTLLPRSGTTVSADGTLITAQVTGFVVRSDTEMTRAETFATEGKRDQEPGSEGLSISLAGFLAYDAAAAYTTIPAPQNKAYIFLFFTGCSITANCDCPSATMGATVGALRFFTIELLSKSTPAWVVAWDKT